MKSVGKEALRSGIEIAANYDKAPLKDLLVQQRDKSIKNLANKVGEKIKEMSGTQTGSGLIPYKRLRDRSISTSPPSKRRRTRSVKKSGRKRKPKAKKRKKSRKTISKRKKKTKTRRKRKPKKKKKITLRF